MFKSSKITLVAYASRDLKKSVERFKTQAINSKFYDEIHVFNNRDFDKNDKSFYQNLINKYKRGHGYWVWKPYFISKVLKEINYGDVINYIDIGCHIIGENKKRFNEYLELITNENRWLLPFQYTNEELDIDRNYEFPLRQEYKYTKSDLFDYFDCLNDRLFTDSAQFWAGAFFIKKNESSIKFINDWLEVFHKRFDLVNDTPSIIKNHNDFIENRHDQSIFSILCKKNRISSISAYECDWAFYNEKRTWMHNKNNPILAKRDLKYNFIRRFMNRQKKNFLRFKKKYFE